MSCNIVGSTYQSLVVLWRLYSPVIPIRDPIIPWHMIDAIPWQQYQHQHRQGRRQQRCFSWLPSFCQGPPSAKGCGPWPSRQSRVAGGWPRLSPSRFAHSAAPTCTFTPIINIIQQFHIFFGIHYLCNRYSVCCTRLIVLFVGLGCVLMLEVRSNPTR